MNARFVLSKENAHISNKGKNRKIVGTVSEKDNNVKLMWNKLRFP